MKVLVACEFSGTVRDEFAKQGHDSWSCDLLPSETKGNHIQGDVLDIIDQGWDLMLAFPPCTYLCSSGLHWNTKRPERVEKTEEALRFVKELLNAEIPMICLENPIGCISSRIRKPDQIIQPYQHGHLAQKSTCLWLKNLPLLKPSNLIPNPKEIQPGLKKRGYPNPLYNLFPSKDRWAKRSKTYAGIARAMSSQWSDNLCIECHQDTSFGSGLFVNRIPAEHGTQDGYLCHQCQLVECDKCGQGTLDYHLDGNILCNDCWEHS